MNKTYKADDLTVMYTLFGVTYYEHPVHGDEAPFVTLSTLGKIEVTDFWELSDVLDSHGISTILPEYC